MWPSVVMEFNSPGLSIYWQVNTGASSYLFLLIHLWSVLSGMQPLTGHITWLAVSFLLFLEVIVVSVCLTYLLSRNPWLLLLSPKQHSRTQTSHPCRQNDSQTRTRTPDLLRGTRVGRQRTLAALDTQTDKITTCQHQKLRQC